MEAYKVLNRFRTTGDNLDRTSPVVGIRALEVNTNQITFWTPNEIKSYIETNKIQLTNMKLGWDGSLRFNSNSDLNNEYYEVIHLYGEESSEFSNQECKGNIFGFNAKIVEYLENLCGKGRDISKLQKQKYYRLDELRLAYHIGKKKEFILYSRNMAFYNNVSYTIYHRGQAAVKINHTYDYDRKTNIGLVQTNAGIQLLYGTVDEVIQGISSLVTPYVNSLDTDNAVKAWKQEANGQADAMGTTSLGNKTTTEPINISTSEVLHKPTSIADTVKKSNKPFAGIFSYFNR